MEKLQKSENLEEEAELKISEEKKEENVEEISKKSSNILFLHK